MRFSDEELERGDWQYDTLKNDGHKKTCVKWRVYHFSCDCGAMDQNRRARTMSKSQLRRLTAQVPELADILAEHRWMKREIQRIGDALFTTTNGQYTGTPKDLQAVGARVEGLVKTLDSLKEDKEFLEILRAVGVDNWSGYEVALAIASGNE